MRSRVVVGTAASFLLLFFAACASVSPPAAAPPVRVVVQTDGPARDLIDTAKLQALTEEALARYAPDALPATIIVRLDGVKYKAPLASPSGIEQRYAEMVSLPHRVPVLSPNPSEDPVHGVIAGGAVTVRDLPRQLIYSQPDMRGVAVGAYTIVDANGVVLETDTISVEPTSPGIYTGERAAASHLAKRVAKLTRSHGDRS